MRLKSFCKILCSGFMLLLCVGMGQASASYNNGLHIVPQPRHIVERQGKFILNNKSSFVINDKSLEKIVDFFQKKIALSSGITLPILSSAKSNSINIKIDAKASIKEEGYKLTVSKSGISIIAATPQGAFYALQSMLQLLPAEIESSTPIIGISWNIPCVEIEDEPAYGYRGIMLDVCRHFHDAEFVKRQLDMMAMFKLNRFHWHLTDDHLWTIEIKKYPRLTQVGSIRHNADRTIHKGFYTQEQIKDIVAYAAERFITVIPEIELPGHGLAALTAYPELSCTGGPFNLRNKWGVEEDVYCAGNEKTFEFLENVIEEVASLFPGKYFHIGGDECPKVRWKSCPRCQARIKNEGLKDEQQLQSYVVHRIEKKLLTLGKSMIGWDEILEGGLAPSATVMSWRGEEGGIEAASKGHDVIMTPGQWLYLDYGQGAIEVEPITINFKTLLNDTYNYNPASPKIPEHLRKHVLGAQGNMWTEYSVSPDYTEYMLYPRLMAVAELDWTPLEKKDYSSFERRLDNQLVRLSLHNVNFHIPMPEGPIADKIAITDSETLSFSNTRNMPMVYTLDGTAPTVKSTRYTMPITINNNTTLRIATLTSFGKLSPIRTIKIVKENLRKSYSGTTSQGIEKSRAEGKFYYVKDTKNANWSKSEIVKDFNFKAVLEDGGAYRYTGYFEVQEDGIYYFSTEMDELQIDGETVLSNDGNLIRHSHNRTSIALAKGKHAFNLLMINGNIGGFPRAWNNKGFIMARKGESFTTPVDLSH